MFEILGRVGPVIPPMPEAPRSPQWPGVLHAFLSHNPECSGCHHKSETAHHVVPFADDPEKELDPTNLVSVCVPCHFVLCHGGNWQTYSPQARENLAAHKLQKFLPIHTIQV